MRTIDGPAIDQPPATAFPAPLVGRDALTAMFDGALSAVADGRLVAVEICGDTGMGKTRMLTELGARAAAAGLLVCTGGATEFEQDAPYAMFAEALRPLLDAIGDADAETARVALDAPRCRGGTVGQTSKADRVWICSAVRRLLERATTGVVLLLDDLHWADQASLELTEYLIRKPPRVPVLVAVAFRDMLVPAGVTDAIGHLGPAAVRIGLPPLDSADLQALLPDQPGYRRELILRAGLGNPLYSQALALLSDASLSSLVDSPHPTARCRVDRLERHILTGLAAEIARMEPPTRLVAYAAAVVGDHATVDAVAHVAQLPAGAVLDAVDHLHRVVDSDGTHVTFRYPVIRAAAYELATQAWLVEAHARAAAHLRAHNGPLQLVADHVERSVRPGDEEGARTLVEAGRTFTYRWPARAALWLGAALRVLPRSGPLHEGRSDTVLGYGRALALSGDLDGSRSVLRELIRDGEPLRAEAGAVSATVVRLRGGLDEAATLLHAELVRAVPRPAAEGMLRVELAVNAVLREDAESAAEHARRAIELLDVGQPALAAAAHAMLAVAALHTGDTRATAEHATGAARLADAVGDPALRLHIELFVPLAWVEMRLGRLDAAARHLARAGDLAGKTGQRSVLPNLLVVESAVQARRGRLPQALETADRAAAAARLIGSGELEAMADAARLRPLLWVSGPAAVVGLADQLSAAASPAAPMWRRAVELDRTLACLAAGDDADCLAPVNEADPHTVVVRQAIRTITLARAGELGAARAAARRAADTATASGLPYENGLAGYAEANLAARTGRPDQAAARAAAAAQRFAEAQAPLEAALAHHLAGVHWGRGGRSDESRAAFDRARDGYLACGASWLLTVLAGQRAKATTGQRAPVAADNGLTTRELEIASLVSAGLSNKDVAARLFLSHRTVESHLSRIFAKLEIRSRVGLANRVRDIVRASA